MQHPWITRMFFFGLMAGLLMAAAMTPRGGAASNRYSQQSGSSDAQKIPIYVGEFELRATPPAPARRRPASPQAAQPPANPATTDEESPAVRAQRLMDIFSSTLVETLGKNGYTASRLRGKLPENGVLLRGVFAEPDAENRIRRALLGSLATGPKFTLYVGTFNLSSRDQPLYQEAPVQSPDARYGPVISLNAFIPLAKYEVVKNPEELDIRKICNQMVTGLTELLDKNAAAFMR